MSKKILLQTALILVLFVFKSDAQKHDNIWLVGHDYFNDSSTIINFDNNKSINSIKRNLPFFRTSASISDSTGNLVLYTNGIKVYNRLHQLIQNGDSLNPGLFTYNNRTFGNCIPEGAIIVSMGNDLYYIFHQSFDQNLANQGFGEKLYYSIIDMQSNNGLGNVIKKNILLTSDSICYGQLEISKHGNGKDWWLIQPMGNSNGFHKFLITPDTILHSQQYIGNNNRVSGREWLGQADFSPDGNMYVRYDNKNDLDIFNFNSCTGILSNYLHIPIIDSVDRIPNNNIASGISFSKNNRFIYISSYIYIYQFDLNSSNIPLSKNIISYYDGFQDFVPTTFSYSQIGPDNKIYIHAYGTRYLHTIHTPDNVNPNVQQHDLFIKHYNGQFIPNFPHYRTPALAGSPCDTLLMSTTPRVATTSYDITLFPNPTSDLLHLQAKQPIQQLLVYGALGRVILQQDHLQQQELDLDTHTLAVGTYFISIWVEGQLIRERFQIVR